MTFNGTPKFGSRKKDMSSKKYPPTVLFHDYVIVPATLAVPPYPGGTEITTVSLY